MEATIIIKDRHMLEDDEKTFIFHMIGGHSSIQIEPIKQVVDSAFLKYWMPNKEIQELVDIHISEAIVSVSERGGYQPYCTDCLIAPPYAFFTKQDAADWWNDRKEKPND